MRWIVVSYTVQRCQRDGPVKRTVNQSTDADANTDDLYGDIQVRTCP